MTTRRTLTARMLFVLLLGTVSLPAQQGTPGSGSGPPEDELAQAMRSYFRDQLRLELALSDEQMERIVPRIEQIEASRTEGRRERERAFRTLRQGLRQGAGDEELQTALDRLERIQIDQRRQEREWVAEVDAMLTVRQRVQFRFFTQRFRRELQRRIQQLRGERIRP